MKKLTKNQIVIGLSYFFCAFNCAMLGIASLLLVSNPDVSLFVIGLVFLAMVPISMFDPRKEMQGKQAAVFAILLHILFCNTRYFPTNLCYWVFRLFLTFYYHLCYPKVVQSRKNRLNAN